MGGRHRRHPQEAGEPKRKSGSPWKTPQRRQATEKYGKSISPTWRAPRPLAQLGDVCLIFRRASDENLLNVRLEKFPKTSPPASWENIYSVMRRVKRKLACQGHDFDSNFQSGCCTNGKGMRGMLGRVRVMSRSRDRGWAGGSGGLWMTRTRLNWHLMPIQWQLF